MMMRKEEEARRGERSEEKTLSLAEKVGLKAWKVAWSVKWQQKKSMPSCLCNVHLSSSTQGRGQGRKLSGLVQIARL